MSRDGWVKRQKEVKDLSTTRLREGDSVLAVVAGSTRATRRVLHELRRGVYRRIIDVPASTGYGEPIQSLFKFKDGERVVAAVSLDPTVRAADRGEEGRRRPADARRGGDERRIQPALLASTRSSSRARARDGGSRGRRKEAEVVGVAVVTGGEIVIAATQQARAMLCKAEEVNFLSGPGKGVILIKLAKGRTASSASSRRAATAICCASRRRAARSRRSAPAKCTVTSRGGKGRELLQRGQFTRVVPQEPGYPRAGSRRRILGRPPWRLTPSCQKRNLISSVRFSICLLSGRPPEWPAFVSTGPGLDARRDRIPSDPAAAPPSCARAAGRRGCHRRR